MDNVHWTFFAWRAGGAQPHSKPFGDSKKTKLSEKISVQNDQFNDKTPPEVSPVGGG